MNIVQCAKGHFYDSEKYSHCPQCGTNTSKGIVKKTGFSRAPGSKSDSLGISDKSNQPRKERVDFGKVQEDAAGKKTLKIDPTVIIEIDEAFLGEGGLEPVEQETKADNVIPTQPEARETLEKTPPDVVEDKPVNNEYSNKAESVRSGQDRKQIVNQTQPEQSRNKIAPQTLTIDADKTVGYFSDDPTQNTWDKKPEHLKEQKTEPPVGWIVCVRGSNLYRFFPLYTGNNSIGRDNSNRISVAGDPQISRIRHASITYEPKKRFFMISAGDGSGLTYLNNKLVTDSHKLKYHDMIEIGQSHFVFVPLCGKGFSWEEYQRR